MGDLFLSFKNVILTTNVLSKTKRCNYCLNLYDFEMETGERKNIQARQSSDGTFELFVGQGGLEEISEEEVSFAEIEPTSRPLEKQKRGKTVPIVVASVLILAVAIGGILFLMSGKRRANDSSLTEVQGFRAYRGNAPQKKTKAIPKLKKKAPIKTIEKTVVVENTEEDKKEGDNVAWKLTGKEPSNPNDVEARIQPNRNPTPESIDSQIHDKKGSGEKVIDDENDDSKEIAAQKRLGFLPISASPTNKKSLKKIPKLQPNLITKELPNLENLPKIVPTSKNIEND